jgi:hypothetical protein
MSCHGVLFALPISANPFMDSFGVVDHPPRIVWTATQSLRAAQDICYAGLPWRY